MFGRATITLGIGPHSSYTIVIDVDNYSVINRRFSASVHARFKLPFYFRIQPLKTAVEKILVYWRGH